MKQLKFKLAKVLSRIWRGKSVFEGYCNFGDWVRAVNENLAFATHWMPLPTLPTQLENK